LSTGIDSLRVVLFENSYGQFFLKLWMYCLILYYIDKVYTRRNFPAQRA
jgi:hypothetical protein